ncbi:MAG: serine hydrolase domain-containing protein [Acidobacteriota bacterium]
MHKKSILIAVIISLLVTLEVPCVPRTAGPDIRIQELLEPIRQKHQVPALAGAILTSKGLVAMSAVGVRKAGTQVQATVEDKWHLGSNTKAMTATLIASLIEQGKLKWDTSIEQVFPDIAPELPSEFRGLTLLHLLSHWAGLFANILWFAVSKPDMSAMQQRLETVKMLAKLKPLSAPGTTYLYSNLGYVIAGAMAERTMSSSWEELITKFVFGPLGMKSVGFGGTGTPGEIDQPWGHGADGKPVPQNGPAVDNPPVLGPAGTVHCTLADWAKFVGDHLRGARGEKALLEPSAYQVLDTPPFGGEYALGWLVVQREWGGGTVLTHAGSNTMNYAVVWVAPERDFAVLIVTNQGGPAAAKACDEAAGALIKLQTAGQPKSLSRDPSDSGQIEL